MPPSDSPRSTAVGTCVLLLAALAATYGASRRRRRSEHENAAVLQSAIRRRRARLELEKRRLEDSRKNDNRTDLVWVPTPITAVETLASMIAPRDVVMDFGSGDARVLCELAKRVGSEVRLMGVELRADIMRKARERLHAEFPEDETRRTRIQLLEDDFFSPAVERLVRTEVTVCFLYLLPAIQARLSPFLRECLRPGSRIITYTFPLPEEEGWIPIRTLAPPIAPGKKGENDSKFAQHMCLREYIVDSA